MTLGGIILIGLSPDTPALAAPFVSLDTHAGVDVALTARSYTSELDVEGDRTGTRFKTVGVRLVETGHSWLRPELELGWVGYHQNSNPAAEGLDPYGFFLGVGLYLRAIDTKHLELQLGGGYTTYYALDESSEQRTEMQWQEGTLGAKGSIRFGAVDVIGSAHYLDFEGSETASGTITDNRDVETREDLLWSAGLRIHTDATGRIEAQALGGVHQGLELRFERAY